MSKTKPIRSKDFGEFVPESKKKYLGVEKLEESIRERLPNKKNHKEIYAEIKGLRIGFMACGCEMPEYFENVVDYLNGV